MRILFCSPEAVPYAKTGGLADVSSALPAELRNQGIDCIVAIPLYRPVKQSGIELNEVCEISFLSGQGISRGRVFSHGETYFIENDPYFGRQGYYSYHGRDFPDNLERFAFFSRACVELALTLGDIDLIHCNDWQTALVPAYIHALGVPGIATCYTIHNLAYQGVFDPDLWPLLFLPSEYFHPEIMEYHGCINIMKAGIVFSDAITTVSPTYAREIQTPEFGVGLEGLLRSVSARLTGIVNGIDTREWNPQSDPHIACRYDARDLSGKAACKRDLKQRLSLDPGTGPLFALIGRLVDQKGIDLVVAVMDELMDLGAQAAILGSGDSRHEQALRDLCARYPGRLGVFIGFDESLAHVIEAGADFFLMPSRFEPCGLNQMISMRYGTIPVVTRVGGLRDTVEVLGESDKPTGLGVAAPTVQALLEAVREAVHLYTGREEILDQMRRNAMARDVSWRSSALQYYNLYIETTKFRERAR
ncbi:MAG: glycogen synthase GlgA [Desulfomonilia bacterium]|jgi:starch synthase